LFGRARTWPLPDGTYWPLSYEEQSRRPAE
jgi:hypothetical protein